MDTVFRTAEPVSEPVGMAKDLPEKPSNNTGASDDFGVEAPIDDAPTGVLRALGVEESTISLPDTVQGDLELVGDYVSTSLSRRGLPPNVASFEKILSEMKASMGLDNEVLPEVAIDRMAGVIRSWQNLSFIDNPKDKRKLFMRLARLESSEDMNRVLMEEMEARKVWQ